MQFLIFMEMLWNNIFIDDAEEWKMMTDVGDWDWNWANGIHFQYLPTEYGVYFSSFL